MLTDKAIEFRNAFTAGARQLAGHDFPDQWVAVADSFAEKGKIVTAEEAARWANLGFTPSEAAGEMAIGVTIEAAEEIEERLNRRHRRPHRPAAHIWRDGKRLV